MNRKCLQGWLGNLRNGYIVRALRPVTISGDIRLGIPYRFERSLRIVRVLREIVLAPVDKMYRKQKNRRRYFKNYWPYENLYRKNFSYDGFLFCLRYFEKIIPIACNYSILNRFKPQQFPSQGE